MDKKKPDEKILERIRRLLAMAKDASSPNEAGIAARRAQKLIEEYNLENIESILSDLEDDDNVEEEVVTKFKVAGNSKKVAKEIPIWCNRLSVAVARLFDCEVKHDAIVKKFGNFRYHASRAAQDVDARAWGEGVVDGHSIRLSQPLDGPAKKPALQGG